MAEICVVHLIRAQNGVEPFKRFIESYAKYRGGIDHDLVIIFKGFTNREHIAEYRELLKSFSYKPLFVRDFGFDIRAYFSAVKAFDYKYYCFLNSYSYLLDQEWLKKLYTYISKDGVGLVGATGSYESRYTNYLNGQSANNNNHSYTQTVKKLQQWKKRIRRKYAFDSFPNYHIRTNGFMISREVMNKIRRRFIFNKMDACKFESGKNSLTKQVLKMDYKVLVVGKDGRAYEKEEWYKTDIFRMGNQQNLLIADNQTDMYALADGEMKHELTRQAWGNKVGMYD